MLSVLKRGVTTSTIFGLLGALVCSAGFAEEPYYDNAEAKEIAQCIRNKMRSAPRMSHAALPTDKEWVCEQLMYLWDQDRNLNVLIVRDNYDYPIFQFERHDGAYINRKPRSNNKRRYFFYQGDQQQGFVSATAPGPAPHRRDYLVPSPGRKFLYWEEGVRNAAFNRKFFPAFDQHPYMVWQEFYKNPSDRYRVTNYGVCYERGTKVTETPCFAK